MSEALRGQPGTGTVAVYSVPPGYSLVLELLTFTLTTDTTLGIHSAVVTFTDATINQVTARIWDWNEGGASMTLYYTYGIGLRPFNCVVTTGMMIPNALPECTLVAETTITVAAVNAAGSQIPGDTISGVVLYGELTSEVDITSPAPVLIAPGLLPGAVSG